MYRWMHEKKMCLLYETRKQVLRLNSKTCPYVLYTARGDCCRPKHDDASSMTYNTEFSDSLDWHVSNPALSEIEQICHGGPYRDDHYCNTISRALLTPLGHGTPTEKGMYPQ